MLSLQNDTLDRSKDFVSVRIAVNADSLVTWFSPVITRAVKDANILLDILVDDQENTAERLRTGEALAAVTVGQKPLNGFKTTSLGMLDYVTVASPEFYDKYFSSGLFPTAVSNAPCLTYDRKDLLPQIWVSSVFGMQISLNPIWVPSYSGYLDCCCNGAGWGLMPRRTVQPHIAEGTLVELKPNTDIDVPLFWQHSVNAGKTMIALTEIITSLAGEWLTSES
jgi:LysR family transcriptional regulator (chromosome initiation inhibitor)